MRAAIKALVLVSVLGAAVASAKKPTKAPPPAVPAGPGWLEWKPSCRQEGAQRDFVAVGRSTEEGDAAAQSAAAEDDARQHLGEAIAAWQEKALRCAQQESEATRSAHSDLVHGGVSFSIETATAVALYHERVDARSPDGKKSAVLMKHDLESMMNGIGVDPDRSPGLKQAVKQCGKKVFDDLAATP